MRIGLYGMPTSGKSYILDRIDFIEVLSGSKLLRDINNKFDLLNENEKRQIRKELANSLLAHESFIMDGHCIFGNNIVFTEEDGRLYDVFVYLYISPDVLQKRIGLSEKNKKYLNYNIKEWQIQEINYLRKYCHEHDKDFYVIDNPPMNYFEDVSEVIQFLKGVTEGFSCIKKAKECVGIILDSVDSDNIILMDGDRTLTMEDSSRVAFGYDTQLFDGNFYTGFQSWKQDKEFRAYDVKIPEKMPVTMNMRVLDSVDATAFILTSGNEMIWRYIAECISIPMFGGADMSAETKLYITKYLQKNGKKVVAYGDSKNDYFMLKQADKGFVVKRKDNSISRSLEGLDLEGLYFV